MKFHTIITVVYNDFDGLKKTLESLYQFNKSSYEHIIIDGNSTDNIQYLINLFKDRIDYFKSEPDEGIYDAMNKGVKHASGDTISFLNAGDVATKNYFKPIERLNETGANYCYSGIIIKGTKRSFPYMPRELDLNTEYFQRMPFPHPSLFVQRRIFEQIGYFNIKLQITADHEWIVRLIQSTNKGVLCNQHIMAFYLNGKSLSVLVHLEMFKTARQYGRKKYYAGFLFVRYFLSTIKYRVLSVL
jgi:glycosyltransferase involved in cell wall biosynthesis